MCFSSLAARFTGSPITVYSSLAASPIAPNMTRPVVTAAPIPGAGRPAARRSACQAALVARIASVARKASAAKVRLVRVAPKLARMPSPMNLSMLPPASVTAPTTRVWYSDRIAMTARGGSCSLSGVKPRRSVIRIAASRSSASPGSIARSLVRIRPATSGAKKRDSSSAASWSVVARIRSLRARNRATARMKVTISSETTLSNSAPSRIWNDIA